MTVQELLVELAETDVGQSVGSFRVLRRTFMEHTRWHVWYEVVFMACRSGNLYRFPYNHAATESQESDPPNLSDVTKVTAAEEAVTVYVYTDAESTSLNELEELCQSSKQLPERIRAY